MLTGMTEVLEQQGQPVLRDQRGQQDSRVSMERSGPLELMAPSGHRDLKELQDSKDLQVVTFTVWISDAFVSGCSPCPHNLAPHI